MRALVTGCRGFIGRHLMKALVSDGRFDYVVGTNRRADGRDDYGTCGKCVFHEVTLDVTVGDDVRLAMDYYRPDVVFHLAGVATVRLGPDDPCGNVLFHANVTGTHNLLAHAPEGCRFVFASSASVYGDAQGDLPAREYYPPRPTSLYAATKLAGEALVQAATRLGGVRGVCLRYVANCGPGATHGVFRDVVAKLKSDDPRLELIGDEPGSTKPYMHVSDTAAATVLLGTSDYQGVLNVSPAGSCSVKDLATCVMAGLGLFKPVRWLGEAANWSGDNRAVLVSGDKMTNTVGWVPKFRTSYAALEAAAEEMA